MDRIILFLPLLLGFVLVFLAYRHANRRAAEGRRHMSGIAVVLVAMLILPLLLFGGCVLTILMLPVPVVR
jgi:hypothetical protein